LAEIVYALPDAPSPDHRHLIVIVHRDRDGREKGYFFDSAKGDHGGSGPFDWNKDEAIERAKRFADGEGISLIVVRVAVL